MINFSAQELSGRQRGNLAISVEAALFESVPGTRIGVMYVENLCIAGKRENEKIESLLLAEEARWAERLAHMSDDDIAELCAWNEAYRALGEDPEEYRPSLVSLMRAIRLRGKISRVNAVVDAYNYISLKYLIPLGAEDVDRIVGDIRLGVAHGTETGVTLGGKGVETARVGEIIYADDLGFICRKWNWREAERTKIRTTTTKAIFFLEAIPITGDMQLNAAMEELRLVLTEECNGKALAEIISSTHSTISYAYTSGGGEASLVDDVHLRGDVQGHEPSKRHDLHSVGSAESVSRSEEYEMRVAKVERMRNEGIEPWPMKHHIDASLAELVQCGEAVVAKALAQSVSVPTVGSGKSQEAVMKEGAPSLKQCSASESYRAAGRVISMRVHGKAAFVGLQDRSGQLQVYLQEEAVGAGSYRHWHSYVDIGDYVWVRGTFFRTKVGTLTLRASEWVMVSKSLHPLPEKFHGLHDIEIKYRKRYLDLITSDDARSRFRKRSQIISALRAFLDQRGYCEVETPMLHPIAGGAAARPFVTHHNALGDDFYLRIAPELYLKRLVVGGIERVYEINRNFRNEGVSTRHNPEFTMLELYTAHEDYQYAMNLVEAMIRSVAQQVIGSLQIMYGQHLIEYEAPFHRMSMRDAVMRYAGCDEASVSSERIDLLCRTHGVRIGTSVGYGMKLQALFELLVEPHLIQPTFIYDFPIEVSPLAKRDPANPDYAARFELFVAGMELSNAYNELNDPFDQAERFKQQLVLHAAGDQEAHQYDADYVEALEHGLPPTVGIGVGIDRLTMLLTGTASIKEVILFPTLKKRDSNV